MRIAALAVWFLSATMTGVAAEDPPNQRVLLVAQSPDGHPPASHEYVAGLNLLQHLLKQQERIDVRLVNADPPWTDGPALLDGCDAAVLFLSEGAKFVAADADRLAAFRRLAERKGGLACLHWAMGTKSVPPIDKFTALFGGCHGGPDRKYKFLETELRPAEAPHPITRGIGPITVNDEFYYALKWVDLDKVTRSLPSDRATGAHSPAPLMHARIDDDWQTVSWAWERPDGGRSFGFSGLHFHANFARPEYRRLVVQGVLWTLGRDIPNDGIPAKSLRLKGEESS